MRMRRWVATSAMLATVLVAASARAEFGDPLPGLSAAERARFEAGRDAFVQVEDVADGLGPVFNGTSCGACHAVGGVGGGSTLVETRFGTTTNGAFDPMTSRGGSLIQTTGIGVAGACVYAGEVVPDDATIRAGRRTTPLFGLGLVDAVPDAAFRALAAWQARRRPATPGRPNVVVDAVSGRRRVGKFGWKSQVPNLLHFSGDAYLNEMGVTSPLFPHENCPQGDCALLACDPVPDPEDDGKDIEAFDDFMTMLAPPSPSRPGRSALAGSLVFDQVGCGDCHVRTLVTATSPVRALRYRTFHPYSDFLLHDMGTLGDGIEQGLARGSEMRTAPLWGLRLQTTYLHDGRATTLDAAIAAHDGQGRGARDRYETLPAVQRARLLAFLALL